MTYEAKVKLKGQGINYWCPTLCFWNLEKWKRNSCLTAVVFHFSPDMSCFARQTGKAKQLKDNNRCFWLLTYFKAVCIMSAVKTVSMLQPSWAWWAGLWIHLLQHDGEMILYLTFVYFFIPDSFHFLCVTGSLLHFLSHARAYKCCVPTPKCLFWYVGQQSGRLLTHFDTGPVIFLNTVHMLSTCLD